MEDNPADVRLVRTALEEHGVSGELVVFRDGEMAIGFIDDFKAGADSSPDLIVLDLNLPKRPGRDVLECLGRSGKFRNVPVIVLSSSDTAEDRADASRLGANLYVRKPTRLDEFLRVGDVLGEMLRVPPV